MLKEKGVTLIMANKGGAYFPIHCGKVALTEIDSIMGAFDVTNWYKAKGYSITWEESTFTDNTMTLPAAIDMTGKRDKTAYVKMRNASKQNLFISLEVPLGSDESAFKTAVDDIVGSTLSGFGTVTEATYTINN